MHLFHANLLGDLRDGVGGGKPSALALILVNLFPLIGVLLFGWSVFEVVILYWSENVVIGAINVLKLLACWPDPELISERIESEVEDRRARGVGLTEEQLRQLNEFQSQLSQHGQTALQASKLFFVPFFTVHYGGFCAGHGFFICVMLGGGFMNPGGPDPFSVATDALSNPGLLLGAAALAVSHLVSYFTNYLGRGEYLRVTPPELMFAPYGRVVLLHIAIIFGGMLTAFLGSPIALLVLLVVGKTALDLALHMREHGKPRASLLDVGAMTTTNG